MEQDENGGAEIVQPSELGATRWAIAAWICAGLPKVTDEASARARAKLIGELTDVMHLASKEQ